MTSIHAPASSAPLVLIGAAYVCLHNALSAGVAEADLADELRAVEEKLGPALTAWKVRLLAR